MPELPFQKQAECWGQAWEILVKRGVLSCLVRWRLLDPAHPQLQPWRDTRLMDVTGALNLRLGILDDTQRDRVHAAVEHLALSAWGIGYTATRAYLQSLGRPLRTGSLALRALWCPLSLPGASKEDLAGRLERDRLAFHEAFGLGGFVDPELSGKGQPANADFILWLGGEARVEHLLTQEYSFDMPHEIPDFREQQAHLDELLRHRRLVEHRGVFARVTAQVDGESFELSRSIRHHLGALTSGNKPFYKLCQACAYAQSTAAWLQRTGLLAKPCRARALAVTPNGLESLGATFGADDADPRRRLMIQMGRAYRETRKLVDGDDEGLTAEVRGVFTNLIRRLPPALAKGMKSLLATPAPGEDYRFSFEERLPEFANPAGEYELSAAHAMINDTPALTDFFGAPAPQVLAPLLAERERNGRVTLRDLHAAAVVAGLQRSKPGELNVIALEGNPGIGKTTAVRQHLERQSGGFLFLYVSPRVVINRDVTESLARRDGRPSGILTITTNAALIASAQRWYRARVQAGQADPGRRVEGAVVVDGVERLIRPEGAIVVIDPEDEREIEAAHAGTRIHKTTISENEDVVVERALPGVLSCMADTTRNLLALNPGVDRVVLTAALQGFRERSGGKTTMAALSKLFRNRAGDPAGLRERRAFARHIPHIVVMVDELAGDGAGAPFVHAVARWLQDEFIQCFEDAGEASPFTVTLVVADASLANDTVLARYLDAGPRTPDKVLVSRTGDQRPFALAASDLRVGGKAKRTLHVMTNSFPASELAIEYRIRLTAIRPEERADGGMETVRQAIRRQAAASVLSGAVTQILPALKQQAAQVIHFAQDKNFLRELRQVLIPEPGLNEGNVQILDSSVLGAERKRLIEPAIRDAVRVFLMTSSAARGVSFPRADHIIAAVPRFSIEAGLMEIAQLIYRGRGAWRNADGQSVSGDHVPRRLVMVIDDYLLPGDGEAQTQAVDLRQWLRQSIDLMTLLVMLRATILTRITGDAGLRQPLALVPVGAVGLEDLVTLMSQSVTNFIREADVIWRDPRHGDKIGLVREAQANVIELFSRLKLQVTTGRDGDGRTMGRYVDARRLHERATAALGPLLDPQATDLWLPDHVYVCGPVYVEHWARFDKQESFLFEGHTTEVKQLAARLIGQLMAIDEHHDLPRALREPAANLVRVLQRERSHAANEFNTLKSLASPNTWVALPIGYVQFMAADETAEGRRFEASDPELWRDALAQSLHATSACMPPIPRYDGVPWAASVGETDPLNLETVFDDRYFMASNDLNLLNVLLLADEPQDGSVGRDGAALATGDSR